MKLWTTFRSWLSGLTGGKSAGSSSASTTDTEFTAEVVRVTEILPHPNADRLEIAKFEMTSGPTTYEVIVGKGDFQTGQRAAYFSVDCIVPTDRPDFAFLLTRPDGKGKTHFRLRAARLRGVFSQGLLVRAPAGFQFGDSVAEHFGVTYHRTPEEGGNGPTAPSSKKKAQPFVVYSVDSLKKLPNLFAAGEPVVITEKIHGTNFRFGWVRRRFLGIPLGWKFVIGSHRAIKGDGSGGFYGEDLWSDAAERMKLAERTRDYKGYTFYGELYGYTYGGKPIQDLTYGCDHERGPQLRIFDIKHGQWLSYYDRIVACADCDLLTVPLLSLGKWYAGQAELHAEGYSMTARYNGDSQIREGCVVESMEGPRRKAKFVGQGYLLRKTA